MNNNHEILGTQVWIMIFIEVSKSIVQSQEIVSKLLVLVVNDKEFDVIELAIYRNLI